MGYRFNRLDEPVFIAVAKPMLTEFGIHYRLESCDGLPLISSKCSQETQRFSAVFNPHLVQTYEGSSRMTRVKGLKIAKIP